MLTSLGIHRISLRVSIKPGWDSEFRITRETFHARDIQILVGTSDVLFEVFPDGWELGTIDTDHAKVIHLGKQLAVSDNTSREEAQGPPCRVAGGRRASGQRPDKDRLSRCRDYMLAQLTPIYPQNQFRTIILRN